MAGTFKLRYCHSSFADKLSPLGVSAVPDTAAVERADSGVAWSGPRRERFDEGSVRAWEQDSALRFEEWWSGNSRSSTSVAESTKGVAAGLQRLARTARLRRLAPPPHHETTPPEQEASHALALVGPPVRDRRRQPHSRSRRCQFLESPERFVQFACGM